MKLYADNTVLAGHLLEAAFAILRNEGLQPVDCMVMVYGQLTGGVDVNEAQCAAMYDYLQKIVDETEARMNREDRL